MLKKYLFFAVAAMILNMAALSPVFANSQGKAERHAEKIKLGVTKIGTGRQSLISVKLKNKTTVRGFVKEANDQNFTVANLETGRETVIPYPEAKQIRGNNLSTGAKVAIGLGILAGVLAIFLIFENYG